MVTFNPLEARRCVQFSALEDDVKERVETITLSISLMEQEGVSVGEPGQTVVDIIDSTGMYVCTCVYAYCNHVCVSVLSWDHACVHASYYNSQDLKFLCMFVQP